MALRWKPALLVVLYAATFAALSYAAFDLFDGRMGPTFAALAAIPLALMGTLFLYGMLRGMLDD